MRLISVFAIVLFLGFSAYAQPGNKVSTNSKKAKKSFDKAFAAYEQFEFDNSIYYIQKAIKADSNFIEAWLLWADIGMMQNNDTVAIECFEKAVEIDSTFFPANFYNLGNLYLDRGDYEKALMNYYRYLGQPDVSPQIKYRAEKKVSDCLFAIEAIKNPVDFRPTNLGLGVNSEFDDMDPSLTVDDETMLFTRKVMDPRNKDGLNEDFYFSNRNNLIWAEAAPVGSPVNTYLNEGASAISPDGQVMVFAVCAIYNSYGVNRQGYGSCDLFYSFRTGDSWTTPQNMGKPINSFHWETQPCFAADGKTLYFVRGKSTREGIKNADIYVTHLQENGTWSKPEPLGDNINSPGIEETPYIHPDGQTLYFSSDGHPGFGRQDIYMSRKNPDGTWGDPINLGYPINTHKDEVGLVINAAGDLAYISSNRQNGFGGLDIYQFPLPKELRPQPVTYIKGKVFDSETAKLLSARFQIIDLVTEEVINESFSDPTTGEFLLCLPTDKDYALNVNRDNYLFYSDHFKLLDEHSILKPFLMDVPLQPVKIGESVVLKNIFFDHDKSDLKDESKMELNKLVALLKENPEISIEIGGHTDNTGDEKYNQKLSEQRAKSVVDYLVANGISADRLSYKGYGESAPIALNTTEEGRAANRRTEFRIVSGE